MFRPKRQTRLRSRLVGGPAYIFLRQNTINSAVADKPRDALVQVHGVADLRKHAPPIRVIMPNLVVLH